MSDIKKYLGENSLSHLIEKILEKLSSKSDTTHNHDSSYDAKGAAATVQSNLDTLDDELDAHTGNSTIHVTSSNKTNWNTAYTHSQSTHARTDATKVAKSTINGNILIDGTETTVYTHPSGTNPHGTTKSDVGLGNVDNTSDANKPVSTAQKAAIDAVQDNVDTVQDELTEHIDNDDIHFTADERTKLSGIATGANKYTHPSSGVTAGTYKSVTVDAQGHVTAGTNPTTLAGYGITDADSKGAADTALTTAKSYTDTKISNLINGAPTTLDTLGEIASAMEENADVVEALEEAIGTKANASDLTAHTGNTSNPHSVTKSQVGLGNVENKSSATIRGELTKTNVTTALGYTPYTQTEIDDLLAKKVDAVSGKGLSTNDYTTTEKTKLSGIATGAEVNQNAFSNIKVGDTTVAADAKTDTLTLAGSNVTITPDATNDKITFAVADGSTSAKGLVQLTNSTSSTSTTTAATPSSVKSAYDLANTAKTNAATAQTKADSAYTLAEGKVDSLSDLGITATATELNYMDGVTSNVQAQLDGKASSAAATTSANGLMTSAMVTKLNGIAEGANKYSLPTASSSTLGGVKTTSTVTSNSGYTACPIISGVPYYKDTNTTYSLGSFGITATSAELNYCDGVTSNIQTQLNGKAASSHGTHVTYGTTTPLVAGTGAVGTSSGLARIDHVHPAQTTVSGNAGTATKLATSRTIDGVSFNGSTAITHYGTCSTAAATVAKTVSCSGFSLITGAEITVKFTVTNTASSPTLNVNSTGAKPIYYRGSAISAKHLAANRIYTFRYNGTQYELVGDLDTNTTYSTGTSSSSGLTKLYTATGTATDGTMTQKAITTAIDEVNTVAVSTTEPTDDNVQIWINPDVEETASLPEIKDDVINNDDTWSSNKINTEIENVQTQVDTLNTKIKKIYGHSIVTTFSDGIATIDLKDVSGNSYKPYAMVLTPQSINAAMRYNWDASTAGALAIIAVDLNGTAVNGTVRFAYIAFASPIN